MVEIVKTTVKNRRINIGNRITGSKGISNEYSSHSKG